jgi:hypothetical protein
MAWPKSRLLRASPTRATYRGGFGAFTAFRRLSLRHDWPDSKNLHDASLSSSYKNRARNTAPKKSRRNTAPKL